MTERDIRNGLLGLSVGDALGVPVEFCSRTKLDREPVTTMRGYGTYNQPPGTWSDDSSLTFCLAESLCDGYSLEHMGATFCRWVTEGHWSAHGTVFDIGNATQIAISRLYRGVPPVHAGGRDEMSNGNGSLMRLLPLAFYLAKHHPNDAERNTRYRLIHDASSLTHGHPRTHIACVIYLEIALGLLQGETLQEAYDKIKPQILSHYEPLPHYARELSHFSRILNQDIASFSRAEIQSSGYVIHTLEAALWCLFHTETYTDCVLTAVNLGGDTDTTAAVAGGIAGLIYGEAAIPTEWHNQIAQKEAIAQLAHQLWTSLS